MIAKLVRHTLVLAAAAAALPSAAPAQQPQTAARAAVGAAALDPARPPAAEAPDTTVIQGWLAELDRVHDRLQRIQDAALADEELREQQERLGIRIKTAMEELDPALELGMLRMEELEEAAERARAAGDRPRLQALSREAEQIQAQFWEAQQQVLQQPEIARGMRRFDRMLEQRMAEVDARTPELIARMRELEESLRSLTADLRSETTGEAR